MYLTMYRKCTPELVSEKCSMLILSMISMKFAINPHKQHFRSWGLSFSFAFRLLERITHYAECLISKKVCGFCYTKCLRVHHAMLKHSSQKCTVVSALNTLPALDSMRYEPTPVPF